MLRFFVINISFLFFTLYARAVELGVLYNVICPTNVNFEVMGLPEVQDILQFSRLGRERSSDLLIAADWVLDLEKYPNYRGDLTNTRVTNIYSLEDIIEFLVRFKFDNPDASPIAVFDVDEMLTLLYRQRGNFVAIHSRTNDLLKRLGDLMIPIVLLSKGRGTYAKLASASIDARLVDFLIDWDTPQNIVENPDLHNPSKGAELSKYLKGLPLRPSHVFFSDDRADFIQPVETSMQEMRMPYTTFHFDWRRAIKGVVFN